jgi:IclR family transcriptional regulator, KDG regulon repressor
MSPQRGERASLPNRKSARTRTDEAPSAPVRSALDIGPDDEARNSTVDRALRVLEAFLVGEQQLGVLELSRQLDLDKSVTHRILATLVRRRFLEQDPVSRRYQIGLRVWELGQCYLAGHQLEDIAENELAKVVSKHSYTTGYFATLDGADVVVVKSVRGPGPVNVYIDPGTRLAAELTVTGRALLAEVPEVQMVRTVNKRRQAGMAGRPTQSLKELGKELARVRTQGYSMSRGDYVPGIGTVAVAVRSADGLPLGALSIDFLIAPETEPLWEELPVELEASAAEIERVLHAGA